ncbi:MAG TPA: efflux RND transporter periplasmic adaptor subunit [Gammaproteobacteria bacterium]|nr:efflux RND transporter periplasmic adaptor subunit [Gammaproteobacteria bacterium]
MKRIAVVVGAVLIVGAAAWWFTRPTPIAVALVTVARGPVSATVANTRAGTVDACQRARLSPALGGQIVTLPVKDGDRVDKGTLLLELWNEDVKAQLTLSERDARASRSLAREACVTADVAKRDADRLMRLHDQKLASEEAADQAQGKAEANAAACTAAQDTARVADSRIDVVRAQLDRTQLRAPFAGVIAKVNGELGEFVTPSPVGIPTPPTVDLIDGSCLYISAPIDEVDAPRVRAGLKARISLDAFPNQPFPGHVRRVAPYVVDQEKQARTVEIEAVFDDPEKVGLLAGYSADVEVVLDQKADVLRVPTSVILPNKTVYVFDQKTQKLESRPVEVGIKNWEFSEILSGLSEGERVVASVDRDGVRAGAPARPE